MSLVEHACLSNENNNEVTLASLAESAGQDALSDEINFDEIIQEFGAQVGIICALESGQKIPPEEAYRKIKLLFKQLKTVKRSVYSHSKTSEAS